MENGSETGGNVLEIMGRGANAARLLAALSAFAFFIFSFVDPFMVEGSPVDLWIFRAVLCVIDAAIFGLTFTHWGQKNFVAIGSFIGIYTGMGVVVLTGMTGGPASPYWTMLMLTFFGVTMILPQRPWHAFLSYTFVIFFYMFWMHLTIDNIANGDWAISIAGLLLADVVSVAGAAFLNGYRNREDAARESLLEVNQRLIEESQEREKAEEMVQRTQQLDAVGRLGAGLAHELNNLLAVIIGSAEYIQRDPTKAERNLQRILSSAQTGARLTTDLLVFAREGGHKRQAFSMTDLVTQVSELLGRTHPRRVEVQLNLGDAPIWVEGDSQLLSQALLNLCLNGVYAMDEEGTLQINLSAGKEKRLLLEIIDYGCGMSEDVMAKAIEPFFTTRSPKKGTGLGLSMAYGTIRDHEGTLQLFSKVDEGTTVQVTLPTIEIPESVSVERIEMNGAIGRTPNQYWQGKHVVLVDDDDLVRDVMSDVLSEEGFRVTALNGGMQAIDLIQNEESPPDLLVLDVLMPDISGTEIYHRIRVLHPEIPILIYSGLEITPEISKIILAPHSAFLRKPFETDDLQNVLREIFSEE